jgi:hypothetical protein
MPSKLSFSYIIILVVVVAIALAVVIATLPKQNASNNQRNESFAANDSRGSNNSNSLTIISTSPNGSLIAGSKYLISPNPFTGQGSYTIQDGNNDDQNSANGIVVIKGLREGNYTVTQTEATGGYDRDKISKIVKISGSNGGSDTATFSNSLANLNNNESTTAQAKSIVYTAKFECGTIRGNEGPLRPGHYDTDIGIFNKQEFPIKITWLASDNDGRSTNSILKTLEPQSPTSILCQDLRKGLSNQTFVEGFAIIQVPLDPATLGMISGSGTTVVGRTSSGEINLLDVQVFYTANALDELPHSILIDKITFEITNDTSGKIPQSMMKKIVDISIPSNMSQISSPELDVKQELARQYGLADQELAGLQIEIKNVDVGVGTMIDDHAVSLSRLAPQASS